MKDHGNRVTRTVSIFPQDNSLPVIQGADPAKLSKTTCMSINSASVPDISYLQKILLDRLHGKISSLLKNWIQNSDSRTLVISSVHCASSKQVATTCQIQSKRVSSSCEGQEAANTVFLPNREQKCLLTHPFI